ncbi:MAG: type II secretion system secretin GspD [Methylococcales bacterium]
MYTNLKKRRFQGAIIAVSLLSTGCEYLGPSVSVKIPLKAEVSEKSLSSKEGDVAFTQLKNDEADAKQANKPKIQEFKGTGRFIQPAQEADAKTKSGEGKYSLNFDDADLGEVSKIILSDMLGENYVLNPAIAGKVTLQTTQPLTKAELLPTLEMLLRMNDVALIKTDGIYRIEPNAKALQASGVPTLGKPGKALMPGYQTKIIPLRYIGATDMMEILTPLLPDKSVVRTDPTRNILMISGSSYEIQKILDIVQTFDVNFMAGMSFGLFPLENVDMTDAITQLEQIFNKEEKNPLSGMVRFVPIKHLNAILIVTQQPQYLEEAKSWVARLDKPGSSSADGGFIVYRVQHVDAVELAATLSSIVSGVAAPKQTAPSTAPGQQTTTMTNKSTTQTVKKAAPTGTQGGGENELSGMQVIADEANNALVITAKPQQYRLIKKIIQQLDVMPLQVLIDATIVAVNLKDELSYGVKWLFTKDIKEGSDISIGGLDGSKLIGAAATALTSGFTYGFLSNGGGPSVILNALATNGNINVLSSPSLMVLNNKEASIHVGDTIPFQSGTSLQTGTSSLGGTSAGTSIGGNTGLLSQNTQIKTGVDLKVKPRVNANGIVIMEIEQKVNNASPNNTSGNALTPTILEREVKSSVAVVSGETVVLGGLISETNTLNNDGIPWLKDLPLLGSLFNTTGKKKDKSELVILITPRVVENKYDARKVAQEFKQKLTGIYYDSPRQNERGILPDSDN